MRNSGDRRNRFGLVELIALFTLAGLPLLSSARSKPTASLNIANNSSLEIRHLFLWPTGQDTWGTDQLNEQPIAAGGTFALGDLGCDQGEIKVVAEDQNGCFLYKVVTCSSNSSWTITNEDTPDCGTN